MFVEIPEYSWFSRFVITLLCVLEEAVAGTGYQGAPRISCWSGMVKLTMELKALARDRSSLRGRCSSGSSQHQPPNFCSEDGTLRQRQRNSIMTAAGQTPITSASHTTSERVVRAASSLLAS